MPATVIIAIAFRLSSNSFVCPLLQGNMRFHLDLAMIMHQTKYHNRRLVYQIRLRYDTFMRCTMCCLTVERDHTFSRQREGSTRNHNFPAATSPHTCNIENTDPNLTNNFKKLDVCFIGASACNSRFEVGALIVK
ncbi:hypothetical protein BJX64DRAFT_144290 [Aspergillus heterothallicus]